MNGFRKMMIDNGQNLSWCAPHVSKDGKSWIIQKDGKVESLIINGEFVEPEEKQPWDFSPVYAEEQIEDFFQKTVERYDERKDEPTFDEMADFRAVGCAQCPFFDECDAMDNPDGWEETEESKEYPDD